MKTVILASIALVCVSSNAEARQRHKATGLHPQCNTMVMTCEKPYASTPEQARVARGAYIARQVGIGGPRVKRAVRVPKPRQTASKEITYQNIAGNTLVAQARAHIGTNPTGWRSLWCAHFISMLVPQAAAKVSNPNMARAYLALPRTSGNVGDLAIMARGRRGGHIGIVSGFDAGGNPIIVSGNAGGRKVRETTYKRHRILAFVSADG